MYRRVKKTLFLGWTVELAFEKPQLHPNESLWTDDSWKCCLLSYISNRKCCILQEKKLTVDFR